MGAHHGPEADHRHPPAGGPLRVGIAGPVGSGKTELVACLCRALADLSVVVVTNDIFTTEDAAILHRRAVLHPERIVAVQTGCCPHTAIRDDISENVEAVEALERRFAPDVVLVESGGDNLTACFSRALVDVQIFVIDVAGGDKVPRKGGPGISASDLLVINKRDLAPHVGADLAVMEADAALQRGALPTVVTSLRDEPDAAPVVDFVRARRRVAGDGRRALLTASPTNTMDAFARIVATCRDGRTSFPELRSAPPLTLRRTGPTTVSMVGSAASPVGGDHLRIEVVVEPGARLSVGSIAASIAHPGPSGAASTLEVDIAVGEHGALDWWPQPLVLVAGCDHHAVTRIELAGSARLRWRDIVRLGRWHEETGSLRQRILVDRDGRPLVRNELVVGPRWPAATSTAVVGTATTVAAALDVGRPAGPAASGREADVTWATHPLGSDAVSLTVVGCRVDVVTAAVERALAVSAAGPAPMLPSTAAGPGDR